MMGINDGQLEMILTDISELIPDHSVFSQNRRRKWKDSSPFEEIFFDIVRKCIQMGLVDGKDMVADGSFVPANVSRESWVDVRQTVKLSMQSYLDALDEELSQQPGFKKPEEKEISEIRTTSRTDADTGYIHRHTKRGMGYLVENTVDCKNGIITGVDVYPANEKESLVVLRHLEQQQARTGLPIRKLALDRGYDTGAVHRGLELLGIEGYIPGIDFPNSPYKYGFHYNSKRDCFICPEGTELHYSRLNCIKATGKYLRNYQADSDACQRCPRREICFDRSSIRRRIQASSCYPAFHRGHERIDNPEYFRMMRLRKIWAEGSFSVQKREHLLGKIRKWGRSRANKECLLSALALNLKRMVNALCNPNVDWFSLISGGFLLALSPRKTVFVNRSLIVRHHSTC